MPKFEWKTGPVIPLTVTLRTPAERRLWRLFERSVKNEKRDMARIIGQGMS